MSTPTILVVDDEPQIRRVMRTTLSSNGYAVIEAKSGEEALELLRKEHPELVLLDVNMPGIGGAGNVPRDPRPIRCCHYHADCPQHRARQGARSRCRRG